MTEPHIIENFVLNSHTACFTHAPEKNSISVTEPHISEYFMFLRKIEYWFIGASVIENFVFSSVILYTSFFVKSKASQIKITHRLDLKTFFIGRIISVVTVIVFSSFSFLWTFQTYLNQLTHEEFGDKHWELFHILRCLEGNCD